MTDTSPEAPERLSVSHDNVSAVDAPSTAAATQDNIQGSTPSRGWRFNAVFLAISVTGLLSALEATIVSTALPSIAAEIALGEDYIWVINAFLLSSTAFLPIYGQLADLWGRRWLTIIATAIFTLGSGISGGANSSAMLIGGRTVQGVGAGGINMLIDLIIVDLVPLSERGKYMGIIFGVFAVGTGLGPVVGGLIVQRTVWRWVFYINLPVGGAAMVLLFLFLRVGYKRKTVREAFGVIDYLGNFLIITSTTAILLALTYGGTIRPWSSWRVIVPLVLGFVGMIAAHSYMASPWCKHPTIPPRLFANRTSAVGYFLTFIQALMFVWIIYFLPVYFQAVLLQSPTDSGVHILPTVLVMIPFAAVGGGVLTKFGRYRPLLLAGFILITLGIGLFIILGSESSTELWAGLQILSAAGAGMVLPAILPAIQAKLESKDNAVSTATFAYVRSYGAVWGATIPGAVFNNQVAIRLVGVTNAEVLAKLSPEDAYASANAAFVTSLAPEARQIVVDIFSGSLKTSWAVGTAIAGASTIFVLLMREIKLRTEQETEFGLSGKAREGKEKEREGL